MRRWGVIEMYRNEIWREMWSQLILLRMWTNGVIMNPEINIWPK